MYTTQYKEKDFILCFTLFTHLVTTKVATFKTITAYNANFKITINKLFSSGKNLLANLQLEAYLHRIKITYSKFATAQQSSAKTKIPKLSVVIAELEEKERQTRVIESIALFKQSKNNKRGHNHGLFWGGHKDSPYTLLLKGNKEKYEYYDSKTHRDNSC